jgi:cytoskeletal protein RodZ
MSLIDEALKRARQEASRQEAAEREKRYARVPVYVPQSSRSRPWLLPVVVAVCLAAGVTGGVLFTQNPHPPVLSAVPPPAPTPSVVTQNAETPEIKKPEKAPKKTDETPVIEEKAPVQPAPAPAPEKIAIEPRPAPTPSVPASPPSPVIALPQPPPTPASAPREEPIPPAPSAPSADIHSYVREVPVAGGGTIRLNGIAFSAQPVALFGDKVVAPGESIGGFTVVAIEAQRVKLQGPGGAVYVTLK